MVAAAQWLRILVFSIHGSNASKFLAIFHAPFYPMVTVRLRDLQLFGF